MGSQYNPYLFTESYFSMMNPQDRQKLQQKAKQGYYDETYRGFYAPQDYIGMRDVAMNVLNNAFTQEAVDNYFNNITAQYLRDINQKR